MKTDYKNINSFEVALVGMITIGFILIGIILFSSLTPRAQMRVASATKMFDIHEQVADTVSGLVDNIQFALNVSTEFDNQFYIAFTQVATLPPETFEVPAEVASELTRNVKVAINNLSDQVALGYDEEIQTSQTLAQITQQSTDVAYTRSSGIVSGASIDLSSNQPVLGCSKIVAQTSSGPDLKLPYGYDPPNLDQIKLSLINLIKQ